MLLTTIIEVLLRGVAVGVASSITVGPVAVLCIQRTLSKTRYAGYASGLGVACADTLMAIISFFFYFLLQSQIEQYNHILRVAGGIFVIAVGLYIFFQNPVPQIRRNRVGTTTLWKDFASMFGITIANFVVVIPYLLAFFAMFGVGQDNTSESLPSLLRSLFIMLGFFGGACAWWFVLVSLVSMVRKRFRPRHMLTINHVAGVIIGVLGLLTIISVYYSLPHVN